MAVYKCKMCGGTLEISEGMSVCECDYCGTTQTLPKSDNEQTLNMFNRANHFRQQCEFDKAAAIYERMTVQSDDAELYWSIVLCRYGIEYVTDPQTKKKIPTCHRTQYKSILDDPDYIEAINHADTLQRSVYEQEATYIDRVQKGILEISNKEQPFDVFICYKESDDNGRRTQDSVLAQELYYGLVNEGFKVFFSRITLESKLGTEYEPYIFAALNSAKVMVVVGTKPEYFNAVWVKNEWSRYLMLMQEDRSRTLIPAYKDMDPYDLPEALSMFQAQDMSKLGFMQDLIRGIKKIAKNDEPVKAVVKETAVYHGTTNTSPLLERIELFLEDGDWDSVHEYCDRVLDIDPKCAKAYYFAMLADLHLCSEDELENAILVHGLSNNDNYKKAVRFGDTGFNAHLNDLHLNTIYNYANFKNNGAKTPDGFMEAHNIYKRLGDYKDSAEQAIDCLYSKANVMLRKGNSREEFLEAKKIFESLNGYLDSESKAEKCYDKAQDCVYKRAMSLMQKASKPEDFLEAKRVFGSLNGYKDSDQKIQECDDNAQNCVYNHAMSLMQNANKPEDFLEAQSVFDSLKGYKDSEQKAQECSVLSMECVYQQGLHSINTAMGTDALNNAIRIFQQIRGYKDSDSLINLCEDKIKEFEYNEYIIMSRSERFFDLNMAANGLQKLGNYRSSESELEKCLKRIELLKKCDNHILEAKKYSNDNDASVDELKLAVEEYQWIIDNYGDYNGTQQALKAVEERINQLNEEEQERIKAHKKKMIGIVIGAISVLSVTVVLVMIFVIIPYVRYNEGISLIENGFYDDALAIYEDLGDYKDSPDKIILAKNSKEYDNAVVLLENGSYEAAESAFGSLGSFKDAQDQKAKAHEYYLEEQYSKAVLLIENQSYDEAVSIFSQLGYYKDSADQILLAKYNKALALADSGLYSEAMKEFSLLGDYKDSKELMVNAEMSIVKNAEENSIVCFGEYQWYVIEKRDDGCTLLCEDIVEKRAYNEENKDITWEDCTLRAYLNKDFYNTFSDEEKSKIIITKCANKDNAEYKTSGGNDTEDYIYILSIDEAKLLSKDMRKASEWWWLRSVGHDQNRADYVYIGGLIGSNGDLVDLDYGGVRPTMNLKFEE